MDRVEISGRRIKLSLKQMQMSQNSEERIAYAEWVQRLAEEQDRAIEALLSDTKGAGPCDGAEGWWPCPLMNYAGDGNDCLNDYGGICAACATPLLMSVATVWKGD
jgi:hypothetical protein